MKRKNNIVEVLVFMVMFLSIIFLLYENNMYQKQIEDRDSFIQRLLIRDSISSKLVDIEERDSMYIYKYNIGENGQVLKYNDLAKELNYYRKQTEIKDQILVSAKRKYRFNYSIKECGDTLIINLWNKKKDE